MKRGFLAASLAVFVTLGGATAGAQTGTQTGVVPPVPDSPPDQPAPEPVKLEEDPEPAEAKAAPAPAPKARATGPGAAASDLGHPKGIAPLVPPMPPKAELPYPRSSFSFGSYGRVVVASDGRGGEGRNADVVAYGSRIDEGTYAELELRRDDEYRKDLTSRIVTTLAIGGPVFHYDGRFDAKLALRNLYLEEKGIGDKNLSAWAGSRMYRGDDIYLLDFWPLDNLNTVGGGVRFDIIENRTFVAWHIGLNRAADPFQFQTAKRPAAQNQPGTTDVEILNRPRLISSLKASHIFPMFERGGIKAVLYGEVHRLPSGEQESEPGQIEPAPGDNGALVGGQIGLFTGEHDTFVNLFFRHGRGLAAYGELATPEGTSPDKTVEGATETLIGLAGNWEMNPFGVVVGGYFRTFREPTEEPYRWGNLDEGILVARPHVFLTDEIGIAVEGSYQAQQRGVLRVETMEPLHAKLWRFGIIPYLSPSGPGVFKRPVLRLIYAVTSRNDDAKALYPNDDNFARRKVEQFFGIGAEWWFNSSSYGQ